MRPARFFSMCFLKRRDQYLVGMLVRATTLDRCFGRLTEYRRSQEQLFAELLPLLVEDVHGDVKTLRAYHLVSI